MKIVLSLIALITGGFMLADGITVMARGKYIGPAKPGPWSFLFNSLGVKVFSLGPLFVLFGIAWLIFLYAIFSNQPWSFRYGLVLSVFTLWYLPIGTLLSVIAIIILFISRKDLS